MDAPTHVYGIYIRCTPEELWRGITDGTVVAMLGVDEWRVHLPVKHGDTIHVVQKVTFKRETSKPDLGIVAFDREIRNQRDEVVQSAKATNMYRRRPAG